MSVERQALLQALPRMFRTDPRPVAALSCTWGGAVGITLAVTDGAIVLADADGVVVASVALVGTLGDVAAALNSVLNLTCTLTDPVAAPVAAATLLEAPAAPLSAAVTIHRWTNPTWQLLEAIRPGLEAAAGDIDTAIAQLNLLMAGGDFAELWGVLTGTVRRPGELDATYTARQLRELLRPRENNQALAQLIEEDTGVVVDGIVDLSREVYRPSATPLAGAFLPGRRYNASTAEVRMRGFPGGLVAHLAQANAAAGITVFVVGALDLDGLGSDLEVDSSPIQVGEPPFMQIGVTAIGVGRIAP